MIKEIFYSVLLLSISFLVYLKEQSADKLLQITSVDHTQSRHISMEDPLASNIPGLTGKVEFDVHQWVKQHFSKGENPPFSFIYGEINSDIFIKNWKYESETRKSTDPTAEETIYTYSDKQSGLVVKCFVTCYNDFPAVEWVLKISNTSGMNTPLIEKMKVVNSSFSFEKEGAFILHHAKGSAMQLDDFIPLIDSMQIGKEIIMAPNGGRGSSDNTAFPFFNIESPASEGVMVAVGWTGKWCAKVQQMNKNKVSLDAEMERMKLTLYPGEEIRTPKICLLFWKGEDRMVGHNQFRRFVLAHHTPKIKRQPVDLPFSACLGCNGPSPCKHAQCLTESYSVSTVERFKQFNIVPDVFWIDAGWYDGGSEAWGNVGNWVADEKRFPHGLKPVSDVVHASGAKFLLWFEPERVFKGTVIEKEHPEWLIGNKNDLERFNSYLFDLGNENARLWLTDYISDFIRKEGVDYYRQDFNRVNAEECWKMKDKPDRIGMSEIRHVEGLYAFWDSLLVRFPNLIIDNCASGGRRIDLETISRSFPLVRSDYVHKGANGFQNQSYGLNFYLPLHGGPFENSMYDFRSSMSSAMLMYWDINSSDMNHSACSIPQIQKYISDFKRFRPYYCGDYYPLTRADDLLRNDKWLAYQLDRPEKEDGIILAFRRENCPDETIMVKLQGLDKKAMYELINEDTNDKIFRKGENLFIGISLSLNEKQKSLLIRYKKVRN